MSRTLTLIVGCNPRFRGSLRTLYFEKVKVPLHAGVTYVADGRSKEAVSRQARAGNRPTPAPLRQKGGDKSIKGVMLYKGPTDRRGAVSFRIICVSAFAAWSTPGIPPASVACAGVMGQDDGRRQAPSRYCRSQASRSCRTGISRRETGG